MKVAGNRLVNGSGKTIRLLGINRDGTEYACGQGWGIFDGPNTGASINAMLKWDINALRLPLSESCWLGLGGVKAQYSGANYRSAIKKYVTLLHQHGLIVVIDLHLATPNDPTEIQNQPIADAKHSVDFWKSVASTFKSDHSVLFDLFNEPHDISWDCWQNGCNEAGYPGVGFQKLVDTVRGTGARQPLMIAGNQYASDFSEWLAREPKDPLHQIVASFHTYGDYPCSSTCFTTMNHIASKVPVVTGEFGSKDCGPGYANKYMKWADAHGVSYLAWTWNEGPGWDCKAGPTLITKYDGTPTGYGVAVRDHLRALHKSGGSSGGSTPTPTPTPTSGGGGGGTTAKTITDASGDYAQACRDITKVVAKTTSTDVIFAVTMRGNTCGGHGIPLVQVDANKDGQDECQGLAFNGPPDFRCDGKVTGDYTATKSSSNPKVWNLSFPKSAVGNKKSIRFTIVTWTDSNSYADTAPDNGDVTLTIG